MTDTYTLINLDNLRHNAKTLTEKYSEYGTHIGIVKGDAYGHGYEAVNALYDGGIRYFAVSSVEEAEEFRKHNKNASLLCLEPIAQDRIDDAEKLDLTLAIPDLDYLKSLLDNPCRYPFKLHIQIDSGFNRLGFKDKEDIKKAVELIDDSRFTLEGIYQHYATAGIFDPYYDAQTEKFKELTSLIDLSKIPLVHLGSGIAMMAHKKEDIATATRMGLVMYGYNISPESYGGGIKNKLRAARDKHYQKKYNLSETIRDVEIDLKPAISMKTRIIQLKDVKAGEHIGYSAGYEAQEDIRIAVLPVGYNNGIGHQNNGRVVEIKGKLCPVVGAVGMNMMAVRVDNDVTYDDEVTLLGGSITLGMFSRFSGLGLAEVMLGVGKNNPRYYITDKA